MPRQTTAKTGQPQNAEIIPLMQCIKKMATNKRKFTPEEDSLIIELVGGERYPNWNDIASHINGKNARQCRERYNHYLAPNVSNEPWTEEEDKVLLEKYQQFGTDWAKICTFFKGRTNTAVKNRFNVHLSKKFTNTNININMLLQVPQQQIQQEQISQPQASLDNFASLTEESNSQQNLFDYQISEDDSALYNFEFNSDDHFISSMGSAEPEQDENLFPYF